MFNNSSKVFSQFFKALWILHKRFSLHFSPENPRNVIEVKKPHHTATDLLKSRFPQFAS